MHARDVGLSPPDFEAKYKNWPVAYHGTSVENVFSILGRGLRGGIVDITHISSEETCQGICAYLTPSIEYAAHYRYAKPEKIKDTYMQAVLKFRVNPKQTPYYKKQRTIKPYAQASDSSTIYNDAELEWLIKIKPWILDNESMRDECFIISAIMLRVSKQHPKNLTQNSWWGPVPNPQLLNLKDFGYFNTDFYIKYLEDLLTIFPINWNECPYKFLKKAPTPKQKLKEKYYPPEGWRQYPLQIPLEAASASDSSQGISEDEFKSKYGNWSVAYYPCNTEELKTILNPVLFSILSKAVAFPDQNEKGICLTPCIKYASHPNFSEINSFYNLENKKQYVQVALQVRLNPNLNIQKKPGLIPHSTESDPPIDYHYDNKELIWFIECVEGNRMGRDEGIVVSSIMLKVTDIDPKSISQNSWWNI